MDFYFLSGDLSGRKNKINVPINGNTKPITNHSLLFLPIRFASFDVISGMLNNIKTPKLKNSTAPIFVLAIVIKNIPLVLIKGMFLLQTSDLNFHNLIFYLAGEAPSEV